MRFVTLATILCAAFWVGGCSPDSAAPSSTPVTIQGPKGTTVSATDMKAFSSTVDDVAVQITDRKFSAHGDPYGEIKPGDTIKIDEKGAVVVNGEARTAQEGR